MRITRLVSAATAGLGLSLVAGCPLGLGDLGFDGGGGVADGYYAGSGQGKAWIRQNGSLYDQYSGDGSTDARFSSGLLLQDSGGLFQVGGVDSLSDGVYQMTRRVSDITYDDQAYEITFELDATWNGVPMYGQELATYWFESDGSVELVDDIDLTSESWYDGGAWTIHAESDAVLTRSSGGGYSSGGSSAGGGQVGSSAGGGQVGSGGQWPAIFDQKSGKIRR